MDPNLPQVCAYNLVTGTGTLGSNLQNMSDLLKQTSTVNTQVSIIERSIDDQLQVFKTCDSLRTQTKAELDPKMKDLDSKNRQILDMLQQQTKLMTDVSAITQSLKTQKMFS